MSLSDLSYFTWDTQSIRIHGHFGWNWRHPRSTSGPDAMRLMLPAGHFGQVPIGFTLFSAPKNRGCPAHTLLPTVLKLIHRDTARRRPPR